ncbi:hypothetical protein [Trinickia terrae]|uniref:hypothetical protein n=1 Tax=Trinickia terrae TaxID=2571161 RepID=UPI00197E4F19|nr:hypothetical protein [Trinickia terrae]
MLEPIRERFTAIRLGGHCRLDLARRAVSVHRVGGSGKLAAPRVAELPLPERLERPGAAPDELAALIASALDAAGGARLPVHATFGDDLVRYFIVTPPSNAARMQDLRAAANVRFQALYGEPASAWQLVADWQAGTPFLACAVPASFHRALQLAVKAQRGCLVSATPNFVAAWNRWRRQLGADAWLATLDSGVLTLGLVAGSAGAARPRLAAVRTLALPGELPTAAWLREQVARIALLDNVPAPSVLHLDGRQPDAWQALSPHAREGMTVHWCESANAAPRFEGIRASVAAFIAARGAMR